MRWVFNVLSMEIRKTLSYRIDFWVHFIGQIISNFGVSYFLWSSIFRVQNLTEIRGYKFSDLMLYYLLIPLIAKMIQGTDRAGISFDIYDGSLSRYLVYPINYIFYRSVVKSAAALTGLIQSSIVLIAYSIVIFFQSKVHSNLIGIIHWEYVPFALFLAWAGSLLYFLMSAVLESVAFWADNVWSLLVMLRMSSTLLGGALVPVVLFPKWIRNFSVFLPFQYFFDFPIRLMMGLSSLSEFFVALGMIAIWMIIILIILSLVWIRGTRQYSGVGI